MFDNSWIELRRFDLTAAAEEHALVLMAMGVSCRLVSREDGIRLEVAAPEAGRAAAELSAYAEENRPDLAPPAPVLAAGIDGALIFGAIGVFLHAASNGQWFDVAWWYEGSAQAGLIRDGEWWRAFTALGLHADAGHLVANLIMGGIFAVLLADRLGTGLAWLAILLAGAAGNALNAWAQTAEHTTIGASTAVFAALGLLAAQSWRRDRAERANGFRRLLPLAGGVVLLSFLGVGGERTDVGAHVFGFLAGVLIGAALHATDRRRSKRPIITHFYGMVALGLFAFAWLKAFNAV